MDSLLDKSLKSAVLTARPAITSGLRVLSVEDNPGDALLTKETLLSADFDDLEITHVEVLEEALRLLYEETFDVVLLDLALPDADGTDALTQVRCSLPSIPVVVLSGYDNIDLALPVVESGAQDYLVKGEVDPLTMARSIRYAVQRKRSEERLALARLRLTALKRRGVRIAVDDFGTGYCSLSYLRQLPVDTLKMDRSFITNVNNAVDTAIATCIISLARSLELRVVAEGVETEEQLTHVKSLAPNEVQGYLVGQPREVVGFAGDVDVATAAASSLKRTAVNTGALLFC